MLATKVSIDYPHSVGLGSLEVLGVLDPKHGYLDTMLGGYVALELQMWGETYLKYGNACEIVDCLPYPQT